MQALVRSGFFKNVAVRFAEKHVEVDLANQRLRAYQGQRLVLDSRISSGREGGKRRSRVFLDSENNHRCRWRDHSFRCSCILPLEPHP
jgi:hypothetical protein